MIVMARHNVGRVVVPLALLALAATMAAAQQPPSFSGLYRLYQAGTEVAREHFERSGRVAELSVVVPVLGLKLDSRTEFDSTGAFRRFDAKAYDAAGDSLLGTYSVAASGTLLETTSASQRTGKTATGQAVGPVAGVIPAQSVAVVALLDFGFRAVISTGFADIFRNNALKTGLLPVALSASAHATLLEQLAESPREQVTIDLETQTATLPDGTTHAFSVDPFARHCLLNGVDELGFLLEQDAAIAAYESTHTSRVCTR